MRTEGYYSRVWGAGALGPSPLLSTLVFTMRHDANEDCPDPCIDVVMAHDDSRRACRALAVRTADQVPQCSNGSSNASQPRKLAAAHKASIQPALNLPVTPLNTRRCCVGVPAPHRDARADRTRQTVLHMAHGG